MQKAYIILAHRYPDQLYRLIDRLDDGASRFFVHIDARSEPSAFAGLQKRGKTTVLPSIATHWAGYSLVRATLNGLEAVNSCGNPIDRVILLSGQDYPIKSNREIDECLAASPASVFLEHTTLPDTRRWSPRGGLFRLDKYYFGMPAHCRLAARAVNLLARFLPPLARRPPANLAPHAGSQWWIIDMPAVSYILQFVREHPEYARFHRFTFAPDEVFFHTILLNATDQHIRKNILADHLRFMTWRDTKSGHPDILTSSDWPALRSSPALFARKFDPRGHGSILDLIDKYCLG